MQELTENIPKETGRRLRILNALSTILVRDHEVVATVCHDFTDQRLRFVVTANPRNPPDTDPCDSDALTFMGNTTLLIPETPDFNLSDPITYLKQTWSVTWSVS